MIGGRVDPQPGQAGSGGDRQPNAIGASAHAVDVLALVDWSLLIAVSSYALKTNAT